MLTQAEAVEKAKRWLINHHTSFQGRELKVSLAGKERYTIVFPPPADTLGGDFTVVVDAHSGDILDAKIER